MARILSLFVVISALALHTPAVLAESIGGGKPANDAATSTSAETDESIGGGESDFSLLDWFTGFMDDVGE